MTRGYHITTTRNRAGIDAEGLRTDGMGWDAGYVWFFDDRDVAVTSAASDAWGGIRDPHDVWEIDLTGLDVLPDPHTKGWGEDHPRWSHARAVAESIPRDRLTLLVAAPTVEVAA